MGRKIGSSYANKHGQKNQSRLPLTEPPVGFFTARGRIAWERGDTVHWKWLTRGHFRSQHWHNELFLTMVVEVPVIDIFQHFWRKNSKIYFYENVLLLTHCAGREDWIEGCRGDGRSVTFIGLTEKRYNPSQYIHFPHFSRYDPTNFLCYAFWGFEIIAHSTDFPYVKCNYIWHIVRAWYVHSNGKQWL